MSKRPFYTVVKPGHVFYAGPDRDTAMERHRENNGSRLYCDHVLFSTRVSAAGTRAERALRVEEGHEEATDFVGRVPAHVSRPPKAQR